MKMKVKNLVFKSIHVSHVSNEDAMALFGGTCDLVSAAKGCLGPVALSILAELIVRTHECNAQVNRLRESRLSGEVKKLRKGCTDLFAEIKRTISFCSKSRDKAVSSAAHQLLLAFKPSWNIHKDSLPTQIDMTVGLIDRYHADAALVAAGRVVAVDELITEWAELNVRFLEVFQAREAEISSRAPSGTNLRPAANESYMQLCTAIEQAANYTSSDELLLLFDQMNLLRKRTHKLMTAKKSRAEE